MNNLQSKRVAYFPNVNSLMKISFGLIFFTMFSTAFVYAETISADETSFDIVYTATGMTITGIESDVESMSLILSVDVTDLNGTLDVTLDRSFFDSVYHKVHTDFFILADGDEALFEETEINSQSRTLTIIVPSGTEDLEIIGSILDDSLPIILVNSNENKSLSDVVDKAVADKAAADKAAADKAAADKAVADKAAADKAVADKAAADKAAADKAAADKAAADKAAADKADKAAADKAAADKAVADKAAQEQCGPGTILQDSSCVLDERCGPGTILADGVCILDSTSVTSTTSSGYTKELIISVTVAFAIAGIIGIVVALISKANRNKN